MAEAIAYDRKKILPVAALLGGEYGVKGLIIGVPCLLGAGGIEKIIEVDLTDAEKAMFQKSVTSVSNSSAEVDRMA
jgi:malate dehydrogenase